MAADGHDMDWLHMLKPSSMSNRNSDSNCIVVRKGGSKESGNIKDQVCVWSSALLYLMLLFKRERKECVLG